jgi:hypothetical protein
MCVTLGDDLVALPKPRSHCLLGSTLSENNFFRVAFYVMA